MTTVVDSANWGRQKFVRCKTVGLSTSQCANGAVKSSAISNLPCLTGRADGQSGLLERLSDPQNDPATFGRSEVVLGNQVLSGNDYDHVRFGEKVENDLRPSLDCPLPKGRVRVG